MPQTQKRVRFRVRFGKQWRADWDPGCQQLGSTDMSASSKRHSKAVASGGGSALPACWGGPIGMPPPVNLHQATHQGIKAPQCLQQQLPAIT
jgi:hypothetical protein